MKTALFRSVAFVALVAPTAAFAQSTGSIDFEDENAIVVTGTRADRDVGGVITPDSSKAKQVVTQEAISRANPGQTILDTINLVPGVSFQNNDAYGSSGGTLTIRGFSSDRISLTFDGIPLNDSGNYAIYSNQQLDPELIEQVNVNLGSTDVDSPTASAVGGTVNYRTINPSEEFGAMLSGSAGEYDFFRMFGKVELGTITSFGTRAFIAASSAKNNNPYNNYGRVNKQQYNAKIYQPIGSNGDFVSVAGNYNENRNNFFGSVGLRLDRPVPGGFPQSKDEREYNINYPCTLPAGTVAGAGGINGVTEGYSDSSSGGDCGSEFDRRYNPSNTGNIRGQSRFSITDQLTLTIDPSYQYVKANGGGAEDLREGFRTVGGVNYTGFIGGSYDYGRDLNGDGDVRDEVGGIDPSQTQTHRYGVISGLRYDINDEHSVRFSYTYDRARHRQTGQTGFMLGNGEPEDVFPVNNPVLTSGGFALNKRDRLSYAILNQVAGEYRGEFGDITVNVGLRAPFFTRDLTTYCYTTTASGFIDCLGDQDPTAYEAANPNVQGPQQRVLKYDEILPNFGAVYRVTDAVSVFASYAKGLSVPGTDNLYDAFFFAPDTPSARPEPETTDSFDGGVRFRSRQIQAQVGGYYTKYKNRTASAYDPDLDDTVFRNLGSVDKYGIDGYVSYAPVPQLVLYAFGSYNDSEIKDNVQTGPGDFAPTAGKSELGSPKYTYGGTVRGMLGPVELGVTAKRTGKRFIYDTNLPVYASATSTTEVFPNAAPAYWLVNADARISLEQFGAEKTYFQLNVYNLFDKLYVGGFGGGLSQAGSPPFVQIGAPRTISGTIVVGF